MPRIPTITAGGRAGVLNLPRPGATGAKAFQGLTAIGDKLGVIGARQQRQRDIAQRRADEKFEAKLEKIREANQESVENIVSSQQGLNAQNAVDEELNNISTIIDPVEAEERLKNLRRVADPFIKQATKDGGPGAGERVILQLDKYIGRVRPPARADVTKRLVGAEKQALDDDLNDLVRQVQSAETEQDLVNLTAIGEAEINVQSGRLHTPEAGAIEEDAFRHRMAKEFYRSRILDPSQNPDFWVEAGRVSGFLLAEDTAINRQLARSVKQGRSEDRKEAARLDDERQDEIITGWEERVAGGEKTSTILQESNAAIAKGEVGADKVKEMGNTLDSIAATSKSVAGREARVSRAVVDNLDAMTALGSAIQQLPGPDKDTLAFIRLAQDNDRITDDTALKLTDEYFSRKRASLEGGLNESDRTEWRDYRQAEKYLLGLMKVVETPSGFLRPTEPGVDMAKVAQAVRKLFEQAWVGRGDIPADITRFMVADEIAVLYEKGPPAVPGGGARPGIPGAGGQKSKAERITEGIYGASGVSPERVREINKELQEFMKGREKK